MRLREQLAHVRFYTEELQVRLSSPGADIYALEILAESVA